jgi:hypothetical protein
VHACSYSTVYQYKFRWVVEHFIAERREDSVTLPCMQNFFGNKRVRTGRDSDAMSALEGEPENDPVEKDNVF